MYLLLKDTLAGGQRTLHVAPEAAIAAWLRERSARYLSIDVGSGAMRQMDLTKLDLDDASFSLVWCSHVLEHIADDRRAMHEMWRVLAGGGLAVVQVPIRGDSTHEDPTIATEEGRLRAFGQADHVRIYGSDVVDRLREAGFRVERRGAGALRRKAVHRAQVDREAAGDVLMCWKEQ